MPQAIIVHNLSKEYRIGHLHRDTMFRERLVSLFRHPFQRRNGNNETFWALRGVTFAVEQGEVLGIIGKNGAGKSTLLKVLSKVTYPTSGQFSVHGQFASLLEVGTGFHDELTGRENIFLNGSIMGMTRGQIRAKFDAIVAFADVARFIDIPIKRYSSGMRLRLGFAVAAHLDPDVLMVDEILAVGDVGFQKKCLKAMNDLRTVGRTVLFVSHNMAAVENLCARVIWLDDGRIRQVGNSKDVIHAYMATFAGKQTAGADLRHFQDRRGIGGIRYTGIEFLGLDRQPLPIIKSGDRLIVRLHYLAEKFTPNFIVFGFRLFTELGTLVTDVSTGCTGTHISDLPPGRGYIDVEIDFLNLMPATYSMSLFIHNNSTRMYEALEYCVSFDVHVSDFYGSGMGITSANGIMFLPFKWYLDGMHNSGQEEADRLAQGAH